eukprot:6189855-Pleurochrysis_carterae.AAC.2
MPKTPGAHAAVHTNEDADHAVRCLERCTGQVTDEDQSASLGYFDECRRIGAEGARLSKEERPCAARRNRLSPVTCDLSEIHQLDALRQLVERCNKTRNAHAQSSVSALRICMRGRLKPQYRAEGASSCQSDVGPSALAHARIA